MQFMPDTRAHYGVDADADGVADVNSPRDAVFSGAGFLCDHGAANPENLDEG